MGNLRNLATKVQNNNDTQDLKNLSDRLQQRAFSWQHEDYFLLKRMLPGLVENKYKQEMSDGEMTEGSG